MKAVQDLAAAALHALVERGRADPPTEETRTTVSAAGHALEIRHRGGRLPDAAPDQFASYDMVAAQPADWTGTHRLDIRAPLMVFDLAWNPGEPARIMTYCRGDWEDALVPATGASRSGWKREQGLKDALLRDVLRRNGFDDVPLYGNETPHIAATKRRMRGYGARLDGPVAPVRVEVDDPARMAADIKAKALALGADFVGIAEIRPSMIDLGVACPHSSVVCIGVHEAYAKVVDGPRAVETETYRVYAECSRISTELAEFVRAMGWPAVAHNNSGSYVQAIPALYHAGLGELGRHGSLIHPTYGASFRPGFVTTDLPMTCDTPIDFGVQDTCLTCNICTNNCPGAAIPVDFIVTEGHRRWLTDMERCYPYSRLSDAYCHLCVDVCPYIHKESGDADLKTIYKAFMQGRKRTGYREPKRHGSVTG